MLTLTRRFRNSLFSVQCAMLLCSLTAAFAAFIPQARADLGEWTLQNTDIDPENMFGISGNDTELLVVGLNIAATSPDGQDWTTHTLTPPPAVAGPRFAPSSGSGTPQLKAATFAQNQVVAVGGDTFGFRVLMTSADGTYWNDRSFYNYGTLSDVIYTGSQFMAAGYNGSVILSSNGVDWSEGYNTGTGAQLLKVAWNGTRAVTIANANFVATSENGTVWTTQSLPVGGTFLSSIAANSSLFVAVGSALIMPNMTPRLFTSPDGATWTQQNLPVDFGQLTDVLWDGEEFVAVGYAQSTNAAWVLSSTDGVAWTSHSAGNLTSPSKIGMGANKLAILFNEGLAISDIRTVIAPTIVTQPAGQTVVIGDSVNFTVKAAGTGPLTYQWYFNTDTVSGGTKATLTIKKVAKDDAGKYSVVVTGPGGNVTSNTATLKVIDGSNPIYIIKQPQPIADVAGAKATMSVLVNTNARKPVSYQWKKDGEPVRNTAGKINGAKTDTLIFKNLAKADAGVYTVTATNATGSATSLTARVTVRKR